MRPKYACGVREGIFRVQFARQVNSAFPSLSVRENGAMVGAEHHPSVARLVELHWLIGGGSRAIVAVATRPDSSHGACNALLVASSFPRPSFFPARAARSEECQRQRACGAANRMVSVGAFAGPRAMARASIAWRTISAAAVTELFTGLVSLVG